MGELAGIHDIVMRLGLWDIGAAFSALGYQSSPLCTELMSMQVNYLLIMLMEPQYYFRSFKINTNYHHDHKGLFLRFNNKYIISHPFLVINVA